MKKLLFLIVLCTISSISHATIGVCCKKDNYNITKSVECYCNCKHAKPECILCGHYHLPVNRQIIITPTKEFLPSKSYSPIHFKVALSRLIENHYASTTK